MPIHDQGYRRYEGRREAHGHTWLVITRAGIMERLRERKFLGLLLFAWLPFLVRSVQLYVASNYPQASFLNATPAMFRDYLSQQGVFVFFITLYVGSGLIANDRRANALQIYLSKPLTRVDYVVGKLATLLIFLTFVTWVPGILLLLMQILFAGSLADQDAARAHRNPVDMDRAGSALCNAATVFRAGQPQRVAQVPEQRHIRIAIRIIRSAVDKSLS